MSVLATRLKCRAEEISEGWLGKPVYRSQLTSAAFLNTLDVRTTRDRRRAFAADALPRIRLSRAGITASRALSKLIETF